MEESTHGGTSVGGIEAPASDNGRSNNEQSTIADIIGFSRKRGGTAETGSSGTTDSAVATEQHSGSDSRIGTDIPSEVGGTGQEDSNVGQPSEPANLPSPNVREGRGSAVRDNESVRESASGSGTGERSGSSTGVTEGIDEDPFVQIMQENAGKAQLVKTPSATAVAPSTNPFAAILSASTSPAQVSEPPQKRGPGRPRKDGSPAVPKSAPGVETPLSISEQGAFVQALTDLSDLMDSGLWYVGLDTDETVPDRKGLPGVPIWHMDENEAKLVMNSFLAMAKHRPEIYKVMRAVNSAHDRFMAGAILGSRFLETGIRFFQDGINLRFSQKAWTADVQRNNGGKTWNEPESENRPLRFNAR